MGCCRTGLNRRRLSSLDLWVRHLLVSCCAAACLGWPHYGPQGYNVFKMAKIAIIAAHSGPLGPFPRKPRVTISFLTPLYPVQKRPLAAFSKTRYFQGISPKGAPVYAAHPTFWK